MGRFKHATFAKSFGKSQKLLYTTVLQLCHCSKLIFFLSGMILASGEKELTLMKAFNMLHEIFPERAFYDNAGPQLP